MVLSAVVTTSASSAAMNDATEVRASTAAFTDLALASVMTHSSLRSKGSAAAWHRRRPRHWDECRRPKDSRTKIFRWRESFGHPRTSSTKQAVVGLGDVLRGGRRTFALHG